MVRHRCLPATSRNPTSEAPDARRYMLRSTRKRRRSAEWPAMASPKPRDRAQPRGVRLGRAVGATRRDRYGGRKACNRGHPVRWGSRARPQACESCRDGLRGTRPRLANPATRPDHRGGPQRAGPRQQTRSALRSGRSGHQERRRSEPTRALLSAPAFGRRSQPSRPLANAPAGREELHVETARAGAVA